MNLSINYINQNFDLLDLPTIKIENFRFILKINEKFNNVEYYNFYKELKINSQKLPNNYFLKYIHYPNNKKIIFFIKYKENQEASLSENDIDHIFFKNKATVSSFFDKYFFDIKNFNLNCYLLYSIKKEENFLAEGSVIINSDFIK